MKVDLVIDGNYILNRLVFILHKNNLLFGALQTSLEKAMQNYSRRYSFSNVYLVSDSKESSWRKQLTQTYKATRKKNSDIDWGFVFETYNAFKDSLSRIKVMEAPTVEGDDWISYVVNRSNNEGRSVMIVSNDYDLKQLLSMDISEPYLNFMTNEMSGKEKIFMPMNYKLALNKIRNLPNDNIFELNDNGEFLNFIDNTMNKSEVLEVDPVECLFLKLVSGDSSDNIESAWVEYSKNGRKRGIGDKGAKKIYDSYISEFGEIKLDDPDFFENTADLICEARKLPKLKLSEVISNIKFNSKLMNLNVDNLPEDIINKMNENPH